MKCFRYRLPLTSLLALGTTTVSHREGILLEEDGRWADCAPLPSFSRETLDDVISALRGERAVPPSLEFALDSLRWPFENCVVPVNALLQGDRTTADSAYSTIKLKVGRSELASDIALVKRVHDSLGGDQTLRLDANRAWNLDTAIKFARQLPDCNIQYIEEPLQQPNQLEEFYEQTGLAYALDESLTEQPKLERFPNAAAFIFKPTLLGGRNRIEQLVKWNKPIVFSAAFESGVGIARIAQLAHEYSRDVPAGLDTYSWLGEDVLTKRLSLRDGMLETKDVLSVDVQSLEEIVL